MGGMNIEDAGCVPNFYKLNWSQQTIPFSGMIKLYQANLQDNNVLQLHTYQNRKLYIYRYVDDTWRTRSVTDFHAEQFYIADILNNKNGILIAKVESGFNFYQYQDNTHRLLARTEDFEENEFHDVYDWDKPGNLIKFGHFYHDPNLVGILTYNQKYGIKFYAVMKDVLLAGEYPIWQLQIDNNTFSDFSEVEICLTDLKRKGQENIIVYNRRGLDIYEFNEHNGLEHLMQVSEIAKLDSFTKKLFFPDLTGQPYRDIVLLNSSGLFVYQYNKEQNTYRFIHYHPLFSKLNGWREKHINSVQFEDIDLDGRQDMLFTGPQGINILSFNNYTNQWQHLLDDCQLTIFERYYNVIKVIPAIPPITEYPIVFTQHKSHLHWASIVQNEEPLEEKIEPQIVNETPPPPSLSPIIPQLRNLQLEKEKPILLLRDQLDCSCIIDALDSNTGRPKFKLPMIDLSNLLTDLKQYVFYDGNSKLSNVMGLGWSLPQNFIMMDYQESIYPEDERYYVVLQDFPQQITLIDFKHSTSTVYYFKLINDQSNLQIRYFRNEERWEIESKDFKQTYGRIQTYNTDSISWEVIWEYWRGAGSSSLGQKRLATAWYLVEVKNKNNNVAHYTYDTVNIPVLGQKSFTREIYLKTISDNQGNKIIFNYSDKNMSEYNLLPLIDRTDTLNTQVMQTRYLRSYTVTTSSYQQTINFIYVVENGIRLLTRIQQEGDILSQPILQFAYKNMLKSHFLEKVTLPTSAVVQFEYQLLGKISPITENIGQRYDVMKNYRVDYGNDDVIVSYIDGQVVLRIFNPEMTEEPHFFLRFPPLRERSVTKYEIVHVENFIAVVLYYDTDKQLCLLRKEEGKWLSRLKYYNFNQDAIIKSGKNFVVVTDTKLSLKIISWDKDSKLWKQQIIFVDPAINGTSLLLTVFDRMFIVYDNQFLRVGYRNHEHKWQFKVIIEIPGAISDIIETLDKFELDSELYKQLLNYFKQNALQVHKNLVLLNRWKAEGTQLYSLIDMLALNNAYEEIAHQQLKVVQDNLERFSHEFEPKDRNFIKLAYTLENYKFKIIVKDFRGPDFDKIYEQRENMKEQIINLLKKPFILNLKKYLVTLNSPTVVIGKIRSTFNGYQWMVNQVSETDLEQKELSIPLGDKFILGRENLKSSFQLYKQGADGKKIGNNLLDLKIKLLNQILIRYPVYLAYQETDSQTGVVEFSNDGDIYKIYKLALNEKLNPWSGYLALVTSIDGQQSTTLILRQMLGIRRLLPNPVIATVTINFDNGYKRITAYKYGSEKALGDTVYYDNISIIPGNDSTSFGWIEETKRIDQQSKIERIIFNAQGRLIKTIKFKEEQSNANDSLVDDGNLNLNTALLDTTGKLEVAQFFPNEIEDDNVGYYGFEDYEVNNIGLGNSSLTKERWFFNRTGIVKQGFSFTGKNYLNLSNQILKGTFQPENQNQEYVASCWIRPQGKLFGLGDNAPYLKAIVSSEKDDEIFGLLSRVKFQSDNWFYLEVIVNLLYAKQVYTTLAGNSTSTKRSDINLKISIIVGPGINATIDVDHIRFSPLNHGFQANVYDFRTKLVKDIICANGLVKRYMYNKYQEEVASINEYGQLVEFNTYTKTSSIDRLTTLKSNIHVRPENGFYEDFAPYSFHERWKIDNASAWQISPGQLEHLTNDFHKAQLKPYGISSTSYGIRLCFSLESNNSVLKFSDSLQVMRTNGRATIIFSRSRHTIPLDGEILIIIEHRRMFVWVDGGLYFDGWLNTSLLSLEFSGKAKISDLIVFSEPSVQVTYFNALYEKVQEVVLEGEDVAIVTEYLYDELGRQTITTKPARIGRSSNESVLMYYPNFVTNNNPHLPNSVWKTEKLQGYVSKEIGEYNYKQITYDTNPLNAICAVGLPGREFSVSGHYAKHFTSFSENLFINNLFPISRNYSYKVEHKPGRVEDISVFDSKNNRVAQYIHVPGYKDLLSTYEYDQNDKLVKSLPPLYHEKVGTFYKLNEQQQFLSNEDKILQDCLGVHITYDEKGNMITKVTPDSGKLEHLYDNDGELLKFAVYYSNLNTEVIESIIYFNYDQLGRLNGTGKLTLLPAKNELMTLQLSSSNIHEYQQFYYSDIEYEPVRRGTLKRTITFNDEEPLIEESVLNIDQKTLSKRIVIPVKSIETPLLVAINKRYVGEKLKELEYPIDIQGQSFRLTYSYNKLGKIVAVGVPGKHNLFVNFAYNSAGQVSSEQHLPESAKNFTRRYSYNPPGFLTDLEDKFLTEKVYYINGSYGGRGHGDGTITRTEFIATWHGYCDNSKLGLNEQSFVTDSVTYEESILCFRKLKDAGYLNDHNRQAKVYYPALEPELPIVCSHGTIGHQIRKILAKEGFPSQYGHSYDYGNHQQLTKAKYFIKNEAHLPLQPGTFAKEIPDINDAASYDIWKLLKNATYIIEDNAKVDLSLSHAKRGKSFIRSTLISDLRSLNTDYGRYKLPLERLLIASFSQKQNSSLLMSHLQHAFIEWNGGIRTASIGLAANEIVEMLEKKGYLQNSLAEEFNNILSEYRSFIPDIVRVLSWYFATQLGETDFDVELYDIDANGNHRYYHTGFDRYELNYRNNTNQIDSISYMSHTSFKVRNNFSIKHDSRGNVIQALHKNIQQIEYDLVSNRANKIHLNDGKTLTFYYDAQGERLLKKVANNQRQTTKEVHYVRDEFGRVLVERQVTYVSQDLEPDVLVTAYIYGPRGLFGFIRRDKFYSVITDHEGSIRLVVKGDEVVAAYDYLPYGNTMREYGSNPEAHIFYRYTGQEWDEEIGLYNYHARFYDPSIGRFYQIDPKEQYFSPYKYAGNSPISMIDPNGEFAWLLPLLGVVIGSYLAGSAENEDWNPLKWNYKDSSTWQRIILGGLFGALTPSGFSQSIKGFSAAGLSPVTSRGLTSAIGVGGIYMNTAAIINEWNPYNWNFSSPETWNGMFQGFVAGSDVIGGVYTAKTFYKDLSTRGKWAFIASGGAISSVNYFAADWDFSRPRIYFQFLSGVINAPALPMFLRETGKFGYKNVINIIKIPHFRDTVTQINILQLFRRWEIRQVFTSSSKYLKDYVTYRNYQTIKSLGNLIGGGIITVSSSYAMGVAETKNNLDLTSVYTYYALIDGMLTGGSFGLAGKNLYKQRKIGKSIKTGKNAEQMSKNVAIDVVNDYDKIIKSGVDDTSSYNHITKAFLKKNEIPNRAISVLITPKLIVTAFSSNYAPGFVTIFTHSKFEKPIFKDRKFLEDNSHIAGKPVTLNDDFRLNDEIKNAIKYKQREIKTNNANEFRSQAADDTLNTLLNEASSIEDVKTSIVNSVEEIILKKGFAEKSEIDKILKNHLLNQDPEVLRISEDIKIQENILKEGSKLTQKDQIEIQNIEKRRKELRKELNQCKARVTERIVKLTDNFYEHIKSYREKVTFWDPTNCAEPHVITALSRMSDIFPISVKMKSNYNWKNNYLATYKLDIEGNSHLPTLTEYPRCDHCIISTSPIENVITDPGWLEKMNGLKDDLSNIKKESGLYRSILNFFDFSNGTKNNLDRVNVIDKNDSFSGRQKRSVIDKQTRMQIIPSYDRANQIDYISTKEVSVSSKAPRISSCISIIVDAVSNGIAKVGRFIFSSSKISLPIEGPALFSQQNSAKHLVPYIDVNGTLLLLDVFVREKTGQRYVSSVDQPISSFEAQGYALTAIMIFERVVEHAAKDSKISIHRLDIDFIKMQEAITRKIVGGKFHEISEILSSCIEKACPGTEAGYPGKLSSKKFRKFLTTFNNRLDLALNQLIQQILHTVHL